MKKMGKQGGILLLLVAGILLSFNTLTPSGNTEKGLPLTKFSTHRALQHVEVIGGHPHAVGTAYHAKVRNYIVDQLQQMGLTVHTQNGFVINEGGMLTDPVNIVTKLKGTAPRPGNDLLVLGHYDSDPHSSFGASDDGSAVAAILEAVRALNASHFKHKNDIIICITDAEEIGLLGAKLFAEQHPWEKDVGLVLNFEARGTSGPSNTILETNHGNAQLVKGFARAHPGFPMASSLMYEVYKHMPNDTDATVFREERDIPSFFFAFIGSHFNYHSALDIPKNLSRKSLAHQGSYLMALLPYFGNTDLTALQSDAHEVYFNFPLLKVVHYSYSWIFPLLILSWLGFFLLLWRGIKTEVLTRKNIGRGSWIFLLGIAGCTGLGYWGWKLILAIHPEYLEILQGFPYNGMQYILGFIFMGIALLLGLYAGFLPKEGKDRSGIVFPLFLWLLMSTMLAFYFKGATFFIIPVILVEISGFFLFSSVKGKEIITVLLFLPTVFILVPLLVFIPVALGIKVLFGSMFLLTLIFGLMLPTVYGLNHKKVWGGIMVLIGVAFLIKAEWTSGFSSTNPKPNSLVYKADMQNKTAYWETYDGILDEWTQPYFPDKKRSETAERIGTSKYGSRIQFSQKADWRAIPAAEIRVKKDTVGEEVYCEVDYNGLRKLNRMLLYALTPVDFKDFSANGVKIKNPGNVYSKIRKGENESYKRILTYFPTDRYGLHLKFKLPLGMKKSLFFYGVSNDLLDNPWIKVPPRDSTMIPKPFVLNDALITLQSVELR